MEHDPLAQETMKDVQASETFRYRIRREQDAHMRHLSAEDRRLARVQGALLVGFGGLVSLVTDLHKQDHGRHRMPLSIRWSQRVHGWTMH